MSRSLNLSPHHLRKLRLTVSEPFELHAFAALGASWFLEMMRERGGLGVAVPSADRQRLAWALLDLGGTLTGRAVHGDVAPWSEWTTKALLRAEAARLKVARWLPEAGVPVCEAPPAARAKGANPARAEQTGTVVHLRPRRRDTGTPGRGGDGPPAA